MFFIKAYRDVPATVRKKLVSGTNEPQSSQNGQVFLACSDARDLVSNRIKAFISVGELNDASLPDLNMDPVYGPILHQVPDWLTQKGKSDPKAINIPAWLRCDACKFFFAQPFCLPCCNSIICKYCMQTLRQKLYSFPDHLGRTDRRVPDPTIPCPSCKESLHGTQIDGWNNSIMQLISQVTIRHDMPGAHELTFRTEGVMNIPVQENSDEADPCVKLPSVTGEDAFGECSVQTHPSSEDNELDLLPSRPKNSLITEARETKTSRPSHISRIDKDSDISISPQLRPADPWLQISPVLKYSNDPLSHKIAKPLRSAQLKLNPSERRTNADIESKEPPSKRLCTASDNDISPFYHGVTPDTALCPWKTSLHSPNDPLAEGTDCLDLDILSDDHPFGIQNQFRMSTEFAPLWRSYYEDDFGKDVAAAALPKEDIDVVPIRGDDYELLVEDEDSISKLLRDFFFEDLALNEGHDGEEETNEKDLTTTINPDTSSPPRKPSEPVTTTPERKTTKLIHGLLTPPDSALTTQNESRQEYPSPTPSWESISSASSLPISPLRLSSCKDIPPLRLEKRSRKIMAPLATPTRTDHATYMSRKIKHEETKQEGEGENYYNLEEQLNDRTVYNRTLDIQRNILHSTDVSSDVSPSLSHRRIGREQLHPLSDDDVYDMHESPSVSAEILGAPVEPEEMDAIPSEQTAGNLSQLVRETLAATSKKSTDSQKRKPAEQRAIWKI